jgi:hypothetical protein
MVVKMDKIGLIFEERHQKEHQRVDVLVISDLQWAFL